MLPNRFNLSFTQQPEPLGPRKDEKDMETTGVSKWSSPPPAHIPLSGAAARTPQDWPGQRARRIYLLLFIVFLVETWNVLRRVGKKTVGQKLGVENRFQEGKGAGLKGIILLSSIMKC